MMVLIVAPPAVEVVGPAVELGAAPVALAGALVVVGAALEEPAALVKAFLVNPLIPLARISELAQNYSQRGGLPCVIFLKVARWWKRSQ